MSRLDSARERLEKAVERLEAALAANSRLDGPDPKALQAELADALQANKALTKTTGQISTRLDKAIDKIRLDAAVTNIKQLPLVKDVENKVVFQKIG